MAIIENKIQYYWVRNRVAKLHKLIDENTPANSPYRIELELLSKLEKEYSEEYASVLEQEIKAVTNNVEKKQINIYEGLPVILEKVKGVALAAVIGKSDSWIRQKLTKRNMRGFIQGFKGDDIFLVNNGLQLLGAEISQSMVEFTENRENIIGQVKVLSNYICMPYLYGEILSKKASWYKPRMLARVPGRKVCTFKEDEIHQINMAAMQIANELKSIEFVL